MVRGVSSDSSATGFGCLFLMSCPAARLMEDGRWKKMIEVAREDQDLQWYPTRASPGFAPGVHTTVRPLSSSLGEPVFVSARCPIAASHYPG
jgi:hypothetical protein